MDSRTVSSHAPLLLHTRRQISNRISDARGKILQDHAFAEKHRVKQAAVYAEKRAAPTSRTKNMLPILCQTWAKTPRIYLSKKITCIGPAHHGAGRLLVIITVRKLSNSYSMKENVQTATLLRTCLKNREKNVPPARSWTNQVRLLT
jgi:hypothetical protein